MTEAESILGGDTMYSIALAQAVLGLLVANGLVARDQVTVMLDAMQLQFEEMQAGGLADSAATAHCRARIEALMAAIGGLAVTPT